MKSWPRNGVHLQHANRQAEQECEARHIGGSGALPQENYFRPRSFLVQS